MTVLGGLIALPAFRKQYGFYSGPKHGYQLTAAWQTVLGLGGAFVRRMRFNTDDRETSCWFMFINVLTLQWYLYCLVASRPHWVQAHASDRPHPNHCLRLCRLLRSERSGSLRRRGEGAHNQSNSSCFVVCLGVALPLPQSHTRVKLLLSPCVAT